MPKLLEVGKDVVKYIECHIISSQNNKKYVILHLHHLWMKYRDNAWLIYSPTFKSIS